MELILKEGENKSLKGWKNNHIKFFTNETNKFNEESLILFEEFKLIRKINDKEE